MKVVSCGCVVLVRDDEHGCSSTRRNHKSGQSNVVLDRQVWGIDFGGVICGGQPASEDHRSRREDTTMFSHNYLQTPRVKGSFEAVHTLVTDCGAENVYIISKAGEKMQQKSLEWMKYHRFFEATGLMPRNVYFCAERRQKADLCEQCGINHFVDDRQDCLTPLGNAVARRYLFPSPRSYPFHGLVFETSGWEDILRHSGHVFSTSSASVTEQGCRDKGKEEVAEDDVEDNFTTEETKSSDSFDVEAFRRNPLSSFRILLTSFKGQMQCTSGHMEESDDDDYRKCALRVLSQTTGIEEKMVDMISQDNFCIKECYRYSRNHGCINKTRILLMAVVKEDYRDEVMLRTSSSSSSHRCAGCEWVRLQKHMSRGKHMNSVLREVERFFA